MAKVLIFGIRIEFVHSIAGGGDLAIRIMNIVDISILKLQTMWKPKQPKYRIYTTNKYKKKNTR